MLVFFHIRSETPRVRDTLPGLGTREIGRRAMKVGEKWVVFVRRVLPCCSPVLSIRIIPLCVVVVAASIQEDSESAAALFFFLIAIAAAVATSTPTCRLTRRGTQTRSFSLPPLVRLNRKHLIHTLYYWKKKKKKTFISFHFIVFEVKALFFATFYAHLYLCFSFFFLFALFPCCTRHQSYFLLVLTRRMPRRHVCVCAYAGGFAWRNQEASTSGVQPRRVVSLNISRSSIENFTRT